jgi:hypothetical protein
LQKEEQTVGQIRYLQKQLRELCVPAGPAPTKTTEAFSMASYLTAVKQELDRLLEEKVEVRNFAKAYGQD